MVAKDIKEGGTYRARVSGRFVDLYVQRIYKMPYWGKLRTTYVCINLRTNRTIYVRSAAKFRREVYDK